jgi:DNA-binding LacI/PurR family transcriptional regulator
MYQIFSAKAAKTGCFTMLEVLSDDDENDLVYPKLIGDGNVDAIVIMGALNENYLLMLDEKLSTPTFYMDFSDKKYQKDSVISGSYYGAYILTNYLFDNGHKDIGYVGTVLATPSITDRYLGYTRALMEHGLSVKQEWVLDDRGLGRGSIDVEKYVKLPKKMPTAFVCNCDISAVRFINYLKEKGYKVPQDISVVGYDDYVYSGSGDDLGITTYKVDMDEMVRRTVKRILHTLRGEPYRGGLSIVEGELIERDSVKKIL